MRERCWYHSSWLRALGWNNDKWNIVEEQKCIIVEVDCDRRKSCRITLAYRKTRETPLISNGILSRMKPIRRNL